jgi:hypothetical protein
MRKHAESVTLNRELLPDGYREIDRLLPSKVSFRGWAKMASLGGLLAAPDQKVYKPEELTYPSINIGSTIYEQHSPGCHLTKN